MSIRNTDVPLKVCRHPGCLHEFPEHYFSAFCSDHDDKSDLKPFSLKGFDFRDNPNRETQDQYFGR